LRKITKDVATRSRLSLGSGLASFRKIEADRRPLAVWESDSLSSILITDREELVRPINRMFVKITQTIQMPRTDGQPMTTDDIRDAFLDFFVSKGCVRRPSDVLVPNDPTVLFTPAGMNQFKREFMGLGDPSFKRATTCQKCIRTGDIENVGRTPRHMTFFEMLGNFSFGDYFKREAIQYAWELLTSPDWFGIDPAKLYVTIFEGDAAVPRDNEAEQFWIEAGVPRERIFELGAKDNFWAMGHRPVRSLLGDLLRPRPRGERDRRRQTLRRRRSTLHGDLEFGLHAVRAR
jgi:hypothetical protein